MKIHDPATDEWESASEHRTPDLRIKKLLQDATDREFEFNLTEFSSDDFFSPRHRHNFDQFRIQLEGVSTYGQNPDLEPGMVAYFPEGTYYGPLGVKKAPTLQAIIQFGGASGSEYVNYTRLDAATAELREEGSFGNGVFTRVLPDGTHRNTDAYQASWERATGTDMVYPAPRLVTPLYLNHTNFPWQPGPRPGVGVKHLFTVSETQTGVSMVRIDEGVGHVLAGDAQPTVYLALAGSFLLAGNGETAYGQYTAMLLEDGDKAEVTAEADTVLMALRLPLK